MYIVEVFDGEKWIEFLKTDDKKQAAEMTALLWLGAPGDHHVRMTEKAE